MRRSRTVGRRRRVAGRPRRPHLHIVARRVAHLVDTDRSSTPTRQPRSLRHRRALLSLRPGVHRRLRLCRRPTEGDHRPLLSAPLGHLRRHPPRHHRDEVRPPHVQVEITGLNEGGAVEGAWGLSGASRPVTECWRATASAKSATPDAPAAVTCTSSCGPLPAGTAGGARSTRSPHYAPWTKPESRSGRTGLQPRSAGRTAP